MTISYDKPKAQPNTFYSKRICIVMQMAPGNLWTVGQMYLKIEQLHRKIRYFLGEKCKVVPAELSNAP